MQHHLNAHYMKCHWVGRAHCCDLSEGANVHDVLPPFLNGPDYLTTRVDGFIRLFKF